MNECCVESYERYCELYGEGGFLSAWLVSGDKLMTLEEFQAAGGDVEKWALKIMQKNKESL